MLTEKEEIEYLSLLEEEAIYNSKQSLRVYVKHAFNVLEPETYYQHNWHIDAICEHLEGVTNLDISRLVINIPPRHMKSLITSVFWQSWVWHQYPSTRWLTASYAGDLAIRDAVKTRTLMESPWYQKHFASFDFKKDQNQKTRFENNKGGFRFAGSVGGAITGEGGDFIVLDDPNNMRDINSEVKRKAVIEWWKTVMSTRVNDPKKARIVCIQQRGHEEDLTGFLLENNFESLILPAEYDGQDRSKTFFDFKDPRTEINELLWEERFDRKAIDSLKKDLGTMGAAGQLQQDPSPAEGAIIKKQWWRFYDHLPLRFNEEIQSWDCSFKDKATSDFVANTCWGRVGAEKYLTHIFEQRLDILGTITAIRRVSKERPKTMTKIVEEKANGAAVLQLLKKEIPGMIPYNPDADKVSRVYAIAPEVEAGNWLLPSKKMCEVLGIDFSLVERFIDQCAKFPNSKNDDLVDTFSQAGLRFQVTASVEIPQVQTNISIVPAINKQNW